MSKIVSFVISATIIIILCASILVPVIKEAGYTTEENTGYVAEMTDVLGNYTYSVDSNNKLLLNGEEVIINSTETTDLNIGIASSTVGYSYRGTENPSNWFESTTAGIQLGSTPIEINADGTWKATKNDTETSSTTAITSKSFFVINNGNYGAYASSDTLDHTIRTNADDSLYVFCQYGQCQKDGTTYGLTFMGEYKNGEMTLLYAYLIPTSGGEPIDVSDSFSLLIAFGEKTYEDGIITYHRVWTSTTLEGYTIQATKVIAAPIEYKTQTNTEYTPILMAIPIIIIVSLLALAVSTFNKN